MEKHGPKTALVILDLMIPEVDGWEVCRRLRQDSNVPEIMLTARGEEIDRVAGLTLATDDYVVNPFSSRRHGGAGIGLSFVKELVEAHGGNVHAELAAETIHIGFTIPIPQ